MHMLFCQWNCTLKPEMPPVGKQNDPCHQPDKNVTNLICDSTEARYQAPKARKITGVRLELSDCEGILHVA